MSSSSEVQTRALEYKQIKRAYAVMSPMYDLLFDKIFHPGRVQALQILAPRPNEHILEVNALKPGDKLSVLLYAQGCIFDYRFLVDRADFDEFADFEDSGEGAVLAATAFAERPCSTSGDFGLMAPKESGGTKLQAIEICAQNDEEAMKSFCGDFKGYFRPDTKQPE